MRALWAAALLLVTTSAAARSSSGADTIADDGVDLLRMQFGAQQQPVHFIVAAATFGTPLPRVARSTGDGALLNLVRGSVSSDCRSLTTSVNATAASTPNSSGAAVLVDRGGGCSFVQAALAAQRSGASLVIVRDTVAGALASAAALPGATSAFDCALGASEVMSNVSFPLIDVDTTETLVHERAAVLACTQAPTCPSSTCVLTGRALPQASSPRFEVCCFVSRVVRMTGDSASQELAASVQIPAVFLAFSDAEVLEQLMATAPTRVQAIRVEASPWNVAMALSWLLGVVVVMGAAYHSCTRERTLSYEKVAQAIADALTPRQTAGGDVDDDAMNDDASGYMRIDDDGDGDVPRDPNDRFELSTRHAVAFLLGASCVLVTLYYARDAMLLVSVLYALGAGVALTQVLLLPLVVAAMPRCWPHSAALCLSSAMGLALTALWFAYRTSAYIWPLQDVLGVALCFMFIDTIGLPSLRVGTLLLVVAFVYDVFFVYVSPLVFGANVMVEVASGGASSRVVVGDTPLHATAPMVLVVPLLFTDSSGSVLLGLGDIILPGLVVALCIRFDYCMGYALSRGYFSVASAAYAFSLLLANAMAVELRHVVAGQPALMYIVPLLLAAIAAFAHSNGELETLWDGPACLQMMASRDGVTPRQRRNGDGDGDDNGGETQPLVTARQTAL